MESLNISMATESAYEDCVIPLKDPEQSEWKQMNLPWNLSDRKVGQLMIRSFLYEFWLKLSKDLLSSWVRPCINTALRESLVSGHVVLSVINVSMMEDQRAGH